MYVRYLESDIVSQTVELRGYVSCKLAGVLSNSRHTACFSIAKLITYTNVTVELSR